MSKTKVEEIYENRQQYNPKYEGKILQLIRFKKDPVHNNDCYFRIIRKSEQSISGCVTWNYIANWEFDTVIFKEGWVKIK